MPTKKELDAAEREIEEVEALRQKLLAICDVIENAEDPQVALSRIEEIMAGVKLPALKRGICKATGCILLLGHGGRHHNGEDYWDVAPDKPVS